MLPLATEYRNALGWFNLIHLAGSFIPFTRSRAHIVWEKLQKSTKNEVAHKNNSIQSSE